MQNASFPLPPRSGGEGSGVGGFLPKIGERQRKSDARVPRARQLRRAMTDAERRLWWHLRGLRVGGTHFRRQATIGPYFADFACHEFKLVIELDGGGHAQQSQIITDRARTRFLESQGYRVLRFWNNDVLRETEAVMTVIYETLKEAAAAPHP
ncbi:MAG: endonuclease domain-containing protein [Rhizobiales bacterium]|nr:endonuclease domain-containing protein [Hyphomicrobiales bacterium]